MSGTALLPHLAVLRLTGVDRVAVLQGQTSNDARRVTAALAQLTSFNNPKGRCYAIALLVASQAAPGDDAHLLITERSVAELLCKKLRMYILRSKATVEIATDLVVFGRVADAATTSAAATDGAWPSTARDGVLEVRLPDRRSLSIATLARTAGLVSESRDGSAAWRRADIEQGLASVVAETVEHFVPLWLGLERQGAIDYKKGCYTGQEIVARTHYLGTVKQQLLRAHCASDAAPGTKVFGDGGQAVGEVVMAAPDSAAFALLIASRAAVAYHLGSASGPELIRVEALA